MISLSKRIAGILLVLLAAASMALSLFLILQVWRLKTPATVAALNGVGLISTTLETTTEGLSIAEESLTSTSDSVAALESTVETLAKTIDDTTPLLRSFETMLGDDLPHTVTSTQRSLTTAQESARIIDGFLSAVTSVPLLFQNTYNPEVPLHIALGEVSTSLDGLPEAFAAMETSLKTTHGNLIVMKAEINLIAQDIAKINASLGQAGEILTQYQQVLADLRAGVNHLQDKLPGWIATTAWVLSFMFLWLGAAQWGLMLQGWDMLTPPEEMKA